MVNVATARFFNSPFNLEKLISNFTSAEDRDAFYDALPNVEYQVRFNKIGEPFKITANVMDYTAGYIVWKNKRWFFFVDYWNVISESTIEVYYTIDAWESYAYGQDIKFGHYHAYRTPYEEKGQYKNYFVPVVTNTTMQFTLTRPWGNGLINLFYVVYDDTNNRAHFGWYFVFPGEVFVGLAVKEILDNLRGYSDAGFSDNIRLISAFVSPLYDERLNDDPDNPFYYYKVKTNLYVNIDVYPSSMPEFSRITGLGNTRYVHYKILDASGVEIWRFPDKKTYTAIEGVLNASFAGASWRVKMTDNEGNFEYFTIPLLPIDIISDAWAEYYVQRRNYDVQTRQIASQQQLVNGVVGNAIGGGIAGATAGPLAGAIGAVGGIAGSVVGYATDTAIFNPKIQNVTDELYKKASDTLNMVGEGYLSLIDVGIYKEVWDVETQAKNDSAIAENGYINDEYGNVYTRQDGPFAGDVQITGIPRVASNQIRQRLVNGVIFSKG